jgi:hypothetical protein
MVGGRMVGGRMVGGRMVGGRMVVTGINPIRKTRMSFSNMIAR